MLQPRSTACQLRQVYHRLQQPLNLFFFNDTATPEIYTLSLHDALPILPVGRIGVAGVSAEHIRHDLELPERDGPIDRSEEHTSELQSRFDLVCRLLLEKKKRIYN